ncbi:MAG: M28 family peptidase [Gammaproteobacteria bacterium]|nr:M28 family peptidase [Gammaproteobacteria bacterium]
MNTLLFSLLVVSVFIMGVVYLVRQPLWVTPQKVDPGVTVQPAQLRRDIEYMVKAFVPRDAYYPHNLHSMALYLQQQFAAAGARVVLQKYAIDDRTYYNVIASYGPQTGPRLVVGAHYDTCCELPGADDNTSGVAGLLALAPLLARVELQQRIDLVAFTLEEPPYFRTEGMGSAQHAALLVEEKAEIRLMIALEMIGYFSDVPDSQDYPVPLMKTLYPTTGNFLAVVGKTGEGRIAKTVKSKLLASTRLPIYSINAPSFIPGVDFSDHLNYWQRGFPAVMLTDTAFYRNKNYHTAADTPEKLDYERMAEVIRGVYYLITTYH